MNRREIEGINRSEELLSRARSMARVIEARVWAVIEKHAPPVPHAQERTPGVNRAQPQQRQTDAR